MQQNKVYIALGSNLGNKFKHLQSAIHAINLQIGFIEKISRVYRSSAFGFKGDDFYNAVILLSTSFSASKTMRLLLTIEKRLGRTRLNKDKYESRTIDLDILFYNDKKINTKILSVPHPELHKRHFVLQPLHDIASTFIHPRKKKSVKRLLAECNDRSTLEPLHHWLKNPSKAYDFSKYSYIAIEGNIGAGKTSLATKMAYEFNAKLILERFADNPFLPKFYKEPQRYAFTLEMSFLADRYQQISDDLSQLDLFKDFIISDYDVFKSLIFSKITLAKDEFKLYRRLFYQVYKDIAKPNLYIYLNQSIDRLQENIKDRGRDYEQHIDDDYLSKINSGYMTFLKNNPELEVKVLDISDKDFLKNRADYLWILNEISNVL